MNTGIRKMAFSCFDCAELPLGRGVRNEEMEAAVPKWIALRSFLEDLHWRRRWIQNAFCVSALETLREGK
jgi:hypothetical protein